MGTHYDAPRRLRRTTGSVQGRALSLSSLLFALISLLSMSTIIINIADSSPVAFTDASSPTASSSSSYFSRNLESIRDNDGSCHGTIITSSPPETSAIDTSNVGNITTNTYGVVFSIENTATSSTLPVEISSLSVYLGSVLPVNYTVYTIDKSYVTLGDDGSVSDTSIGDPLDDGSGANSDGWISVASGELNIDLSRERDADGATLVPLTSTNNNNLFNNNGYEGITIPPSSIKSIYIKLSSLVLQVQETDLEGSSFEGETTDELAVVEGGVRLYVGRGVS